MNIIEKRQLVNKTKSPAELEWLMEKIYRDRGFDFREYRKSTLTRRIGRRMRARSSKTYGEYADVLAKDPAEYDKLFNDLTINVSSFFRDQIAFKALEEVVIPALIDREAKNIRIWSMGCATGEEPYSIAMLLLDILDGDISKCETTILATDIDPRVLESAREGLFIAKDVEEIRPEWLERYFLPAGKDFRVQPVLRKLVTFQTHNMVSDPFYHDFDLVVCRNVLIYFRPVLQTQVLKGIYEGLKQGGFLLLGKAEQPIGETMGLFYCVDKRARLYRK